MPYSPDGSTTGATMTGFTSPTFTLVSDTPPAVNAKAHVVSAVSGTLTATANTADKPFTSTFYKPQSLSGLPPANPVSGLRGTIPKNQYRHIIRKGGDVAAGVPQTAICRISWDIPAGMESYNPDQIKALVSFVIGLLTEEAADIADTLITGVVP